MINEDFVENYIYLNFMFEIYINLFLNVYEKGNLNLKNFYIL